MPKGSLLGARSKLEKVATVWVVKQILKAPFSLWMSAKPKGSVEIIENLRVRVCSWSMCIICRECKLSTSKKKWWDPPQCSTMIRPPTMFICSSQSTGRNCVTSLSGRRWSHDCCVLFWLVAPWPVCCILIDYVQLIPVCWVSNVISCAFISESNPCVFGHEHVACCVPDMFWQDIYYAGCFLIFL